MTRGALLPGIVVMGVVLRVWQYGGNASLWLDEIALVRGILERSLWDLMIAPLPYYQAAPKGFLLIEKAVASAFGSGEHALRLFPLACSLISLVVFWHLAVRVLNERGAAIAVFLFALAPPLITIGALVKQYSTDVCVAVVLLWIGVELKLSAGSGRRLFWIVIGAVLLWFSFPAVLVIAGLSLALVWLARDDPARSVRWFRGLVPMLILWGGSAVCAYAVAAASVTPEAREFLTAFWIEGFPPASLERALATAWPRWQIRSLFGSGGQMSLGYPAPDLYAGLAVMGGVALWRTNRSHAVLLAAPIFVALLAAFARQYPFSDRLIVGFLPTFLIFLAASIEWIQARVATWSRLAAHAVAIGIVAPAVYPVVRTPPVYRVEDIRPVLAYMKAHLRSGDEIYVFYGAMPAVGFYAPQYGLAERSYSPGGCRRSDGRQYLRELDAFRMQPRVWMVMTHPFRRERVDILRYLDTIGIRRQSLVSPSRAVGRQPSPAEAYLYDLSDPARLSRAEADSFVVTPSNPGNYGCTLFESLSGSGDPPA